MRTITGLLTTLLIGCADFSYHPSSPTGTYDVFISPMLSKEHRKSIENAVIEWEYNTNRTVRFYLVDKPPILGRPLISFYPALNQQLFHQFGYSISLYGMCVWHWYDSDIMLWSGIQDTTDYHSTSLHEIRAIANEEKKVS
jgi:hypothetical protein